MKSSGNRELDAILRRHRRRQKPAKTTKQKRAKRTKQKRVERAERFAALQWVLRVDYYETEEAARAAMARVPWKRRAGIVDRKTGETWAGKPNYRPVMDALRHKELTAPERFRRVGVLGKLKPKRGR